MSDDIGIDFAQRDRAGLVTLNRASRLNALSGEMFEALGQHYRRWTTDAQIYGVVMQSSHPSVFCSGGDLKVLHQWAQTGALSEIRQFYRTAYSYVWLLEQFIRPNVPLINGLLLGGGLGITLYGTHRVAGEAYRAAMPQVGIGFFPDIGGTYFLSRLGPTGLYLALTGRAIGPADAFRLGLVTHTVPAAHFHVIEDAVADNHPIDRLLDGLHRDPGEGELARLTPALNRIFTAPSVEEILRRLDAEDGEHAAWAQGTAAELRQKCPTSLKVAFRQMQLGRTLELDDALRLEYRIASHMIARPDYREGLDARIASRGRAARWQPATLADVDDAEVAAMFEAAADAELHLEARPRGL